MPFAIHDIIGSIDYDEALALQRRAVASLQEGSADEKLYLLEHNHVITLGRNASGASLIASTQLLESRGVKLVETDRGGDVTYHGPGQLVGYPILALEDGRRDIRRFVRDLEACLLATLAVFGIEGRRDPVHRGVWVGERKIASLGVRISRWVTMHGFALNVNTDLSYFNLIHPCGIEGCRMTSMQQELGRPVEMSAVKEAFVPCFAEVFDRVPATVPSREVVHG